MLQFVRQRSDAERLEREGWILVAITHGKFDKVAYWMPAEGPRYLYLSYIIDDDFDLVTPCYRVTRKGREMLLNRHKRCYTYEIIRPDLLENGKADLRSTPGAKVSQL
jgi:hypothetical protein